MQFAFGTMCVMGFQKIPVEQNQADIVEQGMGRFGLFGPTDQLQPVNGPRIRGHGSDGAAHRMQFYETHTAVLPLLTYLLKIGAERPVDTVWNDQRLDQIGQALPPADIDRELEKDRYVRWDRQEQRVSGDSRLEVSLALAPPQVCPVPDMSLHQRYHVVMT